MSAVSGQVRPFVYVAARVDGGRTVGVRHADSERALAEGLRRERLLLLRSVRLPAWIGRPGHMRVQDHVELNAQLGQLLLRGVPLVEALEVAAQAASPGARPTVERIREMVSGGMSFAEACRRVGGFEPAAIAVYRAAERSGDLGGAATQLAQAMRRTVTMRSRAATLALYPAIVMSVSVVVAAGLLTFIVPRIGEALAQMGATLPAFSRVVLGLGVWLRQHGGWVLAGAGAAAVLAWAGRAWVREGLFALARRVPMVRELILAQESARFFSVMAAMTRAGVPLADALGVAAETIALPGLRAQMRTLQTRLIEGGVLRVLIEHVTALPLATRRLLVAAERAGDLETAFGALAGDYAEEVERRAARLLAALEPLLIVGMFLIIGAIVLAIMIPLLSATAGIQT